MTDASTIIALCVATTPVDLRANQVELEELNVSYDRYRTLSFLQRVTHTNPSYYNQQAVRLDMYGKVRFRGKIKTVEHVGSPESELVRYVAYGAREQAAEVNVLDDNGSPRVVFNAPYEDEEFAFARQNWSVGQMIQWLFEQHRTELNSKGVIDTASATLSNSYGYAPVEVSSMSWKPDKVVLSAMTFDQALTNLMKISPGYAYIYDPHNQIFRFRKVNSLSTTVITYNNSIDVVKNVSLNPDTTDRYTAMRIVGAKQPKSLSIFESTGDLTRLWDSSLEATWSLPKAWGGAHTGSGTITTGTASMVVDSSQTWAVNKWKDGLLTIVSTGTFSNVKSYRIITRSTTTGVYIEPNWMVVPQAGAAYKISSAVSPYRYVYSRWQVTSPAYRHIAKEMTYGGSWILGGLVYEIARTRGPRLWRKVIGSVGSNTLSTWMPVPADFFWRSGVMLSRLPVWQGTKLSTFTPGTSSPAVDVRLDYAYLSDPTSVRYPTSGFTGTAYGTFGIERELVIYDEEFQDETQVDRYMEMATNLLDAYKDVLYDGHVQQAQKFNVAFSNLGLRVNIAAQTGAGSPITTGFENIGAMVTEASYNFQGHSTKLTLTTGLEFTFDEVKRMFSDETKVQWRRGLRLDDASVFPPDLQVCSDTCGETSPPCENPPCGEDHLCGSGHPCSSEHVCGDEVTPCVEGDNMTPDPPDDGSDEVCGDEQVCPMGQVCDEDHICGPGMLPCDSQAPPCDGETPTCDGQTPQPPGPICPTEGGCGAVENAPDYSWFEHECCNYAPYSFSFTGTGYTNVVSEDCTDWNFSDYLEWDPVDQRWEYSDPDRTITLTCAIYSEESQPCDGKTYWQLQLSSVACSCLYTSWEDGCGGADNCENDFCDGGVFDSDCCSSGPDCLAGSFTITPV